jgi:hypothetical protein
VIVPWQSGCAAIQGQVSGMLQTDPQVMQYSPRFPAENTIFATTVGPQEPFTVAKIQVFTEPALTPPFIGHWSLVI